MELIKELFSSPFGILSAIVILFMLAMAVFFVILFIKKSGKKPNQE